MQIIVRAEIHTSTIQSIACFASDIFVLEAIQSTQQILQRLSLRPDHNYGARLQWDA